MIELGTCGPETPAMVQIAALVEERRRLLGRSGSAAELPAAERHARLQAVGQELERTWIQRRQELARLAPGDGRASAARLTSMARRAAANAPAAVDARPNPDGGDGARSVRWLGRGT